jgi:hypothetical protein
MKRNLFVSGMLALLFGFVLAGCAGVPKLVTKVRDTAIPAEQHARLILGLGVTHIFAFDESGVPSIMSRAFVTPMEVALIPPGSHSFYVMTKESYGLSPGRVVSTPWPGVKMTYVFEPGQYYVIIGRLWGGNVVYEIEKLEEPYGAIGGYTADWYRTRIPQVEERIQALK